MRGLALRTADRTQTMAELARSLREKKNAPSAMPEKPPKPKKEAPAKETTLKNYNSN